MPVSAVSLQQTMSAELLSILDESFDPVARVNLLNLERVLISKCTDIEDATAEGLAVEGFWQSNELCRTWTLPSVPENKKLLFGMFCELASSTDDAFRPVHWAHMFQWGRQGPGRAAGTDARSFYDKMFNAPLTTAHSWLIPMYHRYVSHFPEWLVGEQRRTTSFGVVKVVAGNSLSTVPKKRTVRRTTCKEPSLDMFFQLGLGSIIEEYLGRELGIRLDTQPYINKRLAREGSLSGKYCTIDLKSASDRIGRKMAGVFFPRLAGLITSVSSSVTTYKGRKRATYMLSTMGNGCTFPFQTLLFSTVVRAAWQRRYNTLSKRNGLTWGVFGDDIVAPNELYEDIVWLCDLLGFEVNVDKSFHTGNFRESCGGDYVSGHDVRGVYAKSLLQPHDRYSLANRLMYWCVNSGVLLRRTLAHLLDGLPAYHVPMWYDVNAGIRVPWFCCALKDNQRFRCWVPRVKRIKYTMEDAGGLYTAFLQESLRTPELSEHRMKQRRNFLVKCMERGVITVPLEDSGGEPLFTLEYKTCPPELWDGQVHGAGERLKITPAWTSRYEEYAMEITLRNRPRSC